MVGFMAVGSDNGNLSGPFPLAVSGHSRGKKACFWNRPVGAGRVNGPISRFLLLIAYIKIETEPRIGQFLQAALLLPAGKRPKKAKKPDCVPIWWLAGPMSPTAEALCPLRRSFRPYQGGCSSPEPLLQPNARLLSAQLGYNRPCYFSSGVKGGGTNGHMGSTAISGAVSGSYEPSGPI